MSATRTQPPRTGKAGAGVGKEGAGVGKAGASVGKSPPNNRSNQNARAEKAGIAIIDELKENIQRIKDRQNILKNQGKDLDEQYKAELENNERQYAELLRKLHNVQPMDGVETSSESQAGAHSDGSDTGVGGTDGGDTSGGGTDGGGREGGGREGGGRGGERAVPKKTLIRDEVLGATFEVSEDPHLDDEEKHYRDIEQRVYGHKKIGNKITYLIRYGNKEANSYRFNDVPPGSCPDYDPIPEKNINSKANRIIEPIIDFCGGDLPHNIFKHVQILGVFWKSKTGLGREAEVNALLPGWHKRDDTHCYIQLNLEYYQNHMAKWGITNRRGFSFETKTTMLKILPGNSQKEKLKALYNRAVRLEEDFETKCMKRTHLNPLRSKSASVPPISSHPYPSPRPSPSPVVSRPPLDAGQDNSTSSQDLTDWNEHLKLFFLSRGYGPNTNLKDLSEDEKNTLPGSFEYWKRKKYCPL
jgi:hypothetical protein